jgi:uncharacterized protein YraI
MYKFFKGAVAMLLVLGVLCSLALPAFASSEIKEAIGIVKARSGLRLRSEATTSSETLAIAPYGDSVVVISRRGDWCKVNYNLEIGYMHADYLTLKERENVDLGTGSIDGSVVNMRSRPTTDSSIVTQLRRNNEVDIFGFNCGWYKVNANGKIGYIRSDLVELLEIPPENFRPATESNPDTETEPDTESVPDGTKIATYAQGFVGCPYVYGGTTPSGFDCSGFVQYVYRHFGITINRTATAQLANGYRVDRSEMQPGDLVFFGYGNTASHVGIYIGDGKFVHAQNSNTGVVITDLSVSYYDNRFLCARRIVD